MKVKNTSRQPLMLNIGRSPEGELKDIHLRASGVSGCVSRELTEDEFKSPEIQKLLGKSLQLIG